MYANEIDLYRIYIMFTRNQRITLSLSYWIIIILVPHYLTSVYLTLSYHSKLLIKILTIPNILIPIQTTVTKCLVHVISHT